MTITEAHLQELEPEIAITRRMLERVPYKPDYAPDEKSMRLGYLAALVAQLPEFGIQVLTTPALDFSAGTFRPLKFESAQQLVAAFDEYSAALRNALANTSDDAWEEGWKLLYQSDKVLFEGSRFLSYRQMFLNHLVHHRAQLGVYLRLNGIPVPSVYGPSADEKGS